mmetsp:Transcript_6037/g.9289  ORF Transcript_6037/g.9289 Transcript_6037/m.9289 type:complete len:351 (-) Transcript_6037:238-1290(-)|eukprot:CAMPEP_0195297918 /NCGR_PEP_ID=MMETSP0707-20130614/22386_1 /TAXON_ID=33640 /ORGANISM="Asterionellopsis glacialis, Strain CCMP134" /LENGTH=350 /DNA_ID=CAMNT_0040359849 /DNA_START=116 /DNA_END=1168 /DNA_ORIENTATION=+
MPVPEGTRITIRLPDDFHHHAREGSRTALVMKHAVKRFGHCLFMPNTKPPLVNTQMALKYRQHIVDSSPQDTPDTFKPQMTLYLTDNSSPDEIKKAYATGLIVAVKYYPAGATTNSDFGVSDFKRVYPVFKAMEEVGMKLCIHSEVTHGDIFDREPIFIDEILKPIVKDFPKLKVIMEHISTKEAVEYVLEASDNVRASITCHHLLYNRNAMLVGGIKPHLYCLPILKREIHREALIKAATSGNKKFFLGTDSAPHPIGAKQSACGCAGVYTAHAAVELYAEAFDSMDALDKLEDFSSSYGADHYGLPRNTQTITLEKKSWDVPESFDFGEGDTVVPLRAGGQVAWSIVS